MTRALCFALMSAQALLQSTRLKKFIQSNIREYTAALQLLGSCA